MNVFDKLKIKTDSELEKESKINLTQKNEKTSQELRYKRQNIRLYIFYIIIILIIILTIKSLVDNVLLFDSLNPNPKYCNYKSKKKNFKFKFFK